MLALRRSNALPAHLLWKTISDTNLAPPPPCATICRFNFIALLPFMLAKARPAELFENFHRQFAGLIAVGLFFSMGLGLNNISLMTVPLSVNQMIRAGLPVFTAVFAIFIEAKTPTRVSSVSPGKAGHD